MRKGIAMVALVLAAATVAGAAPVPDGAECAQTGALGKLLTVQLNPTNQDNADRFAICVTDGVSANGAEFYFGGELNPELSKTSDFCGALIVGGRVLSGTADWDRVTPGIDPRETDDDVHLRCD